MLRQNRITATNNNRSFHNVVKFTNIADPWTTLQFRHRRRRHCDLCTSRCRIAEEPFCQQRDVFRPLAKRLGRSMQKRVRRKNRSLRKMPVPSHSLLKVTIRRSHQTKRSMTTRATSDWTHFARFQSPQKFHLQIQ